MEEYFLDILDPKTRVDGGDQLAKVRQEAIDKLDKIRKIIL